MVYDLFNSLQIQRYRGLILIPFAFLDILGQIFVIVIFYHHNPMYLIIVFSIKFVILLCSQVKTLYKLPYANDDYLFLLIYQIKMNHVI